MDNDQMDEKVRGFRLKNVSILLFLVEALLAVLILIESGVALDCFEDQKRTSDVTEQAQKLVYDLEQETFYLMAQSRLYIAAEDTTYMNSYFERLENKTSRKTMVADFRRKYGAENKDVCDTLDDAVMGSDTLLEMDLHALSLMSRYLELETQTLPESLQEYELSAEELALGKEEWKTLAHELLFGAEYTGIEKDLMAKFAEIHDWLLEHTAQKTEEYTARMSGSLSFERLMAFLLILIMSIVFVGILLLVVRPLNSIARQLQEEAVIETRGFYEMRYLASSYNDFCRVNEASKLELNQQANYDALTGILNRGSFNRLCDFFRGSLHPIVFLLIDVDTFKSINDNYGHEVGDQALKKVARVLKESIREEDYAIRYGGDEFCAILVGLKPSEKQSIGSKIDSMNRILMNPTEEGMPAFSLSVGVAFSPKGFNEEVFKKADKAVYFTKSNGRCGYTFYQEHMVKMDSKVR